MRRSLTFTDDDVAVMAQIQYMLTGENTTIRFMPSEDNLLAAAGGFIAKGMAVTDTLVALRELLRTERRRKR